GLGLQHTSCRILPMPGAAPPESMDRKLEIVTDVPDRAMVIFAHPDDAEIGSGGVVARWVAAGCEGTYVLGTNGDAGTPELAPTWMPQHRWPATRPRPTGCRGSGTGAWTSRT